MSFGQIGAFVLVLVAVFLAGTVWFHLVESLLDRVRSLFTRHREPPPWHPLPPEREDGEDRQP